MGGASTIVWVDEPTGGLGSRVAAQLAAVDHVRPGDLVDADVVVWLSSADPDERARRRQSAAHGLAAALAGAHAATHVVLVSSGLVYGAWPNNPVPITEDAALRPDVEFDYARQLGAVELAVDQWRRALPGRTVCVLRPAVAMAADGTTILARALAAGMGQRHGEDDPPAQFVHLDDLAAAVVVGVERRLDGVYNVAPDGWVAGDRVRALAGVAPRLRLPEWANATIGGLRWRFQRGPIPPGLRSYTRWPWLLANDKLRSEGWQPTVSNEETYVEGTEAKWFTMITPQRRQELSLGAMVGGIVVALAATAALVARRVRRR
jgi:nucleoside-diphosphate-sugar epimerase